MNRLLAALMVIAAVAAPRESSAYVRTQTAPNSGIDLFWGSHTGLTWALSVPTDIVDIAPSLPAGEALGTIEASFQTWTDVPDVGLTFDFQGTTHRMDVGYVPGASDNINLLVFRDSGLCADPSVVPTNDPCVSSSDAFACANAYNCWSHSTDIYALTTTTYNTSTGQLVDADTEYNALPQINRFTVTAAGLPPCANPLDFTATGCIDVDLQNTVTHEIGHYLGLAHTPVATATMYATAPLGQTSKRILSPDDIAGINAIYPPGSGSGSGSGTGCAGTPATLLSAGVVVLVLMRRRRPSSHS